MNKNELIARGAALPVLPPAPQKANISSHFQPFYGHAEADVGFLKAPCDFRQQFFAKSLSIFAADRQKANIGRILLHSLAASTAAPALRPRPLATAAPAPRPPWGGQARPRAQGRRGRGRRRTSTRPGRRRTSTRPGRRRTCTRPGRRRKCTRPGVRTGR